MTSHRTTRLIVEQFDPARPKPGGIDTCIRGLIRYCPADVELLIAGVDAIGDKQLGVWHDLSVDGVPVKFMPVTRLDHANLRRWIPHSVRLVLGIARYRPGRKADIVQSHRLNVGLALLALYRRLPHVQLIHSSGERNLGPESKSYFKHFVAAYRWLERFVIPRSSRTVVFSRPGADRLKALAPTVEFSPTWYDAERFHPAEKDESPSRRRVLWACRLEPAKDPALAIEAARLLPEVSFTLAGGGTLEAESRRGAADLENVTLVGPVDKADMGDLMRDHDVLLMTSHFEGFSRSIVEALGSGLPVATTEGGDPNALVVEGRNGARAQERTAESVAQAVRHALLCDPHDAISSVADLSADRVVARVLRPLDREPSEENA